MIEFIKGSWDKVLSILVSIAVAGFVFYRRFLRVEDKLAEHIKADDDLKSELKAGLAKLGTMELRAERHEVLITETRDDVKELREDMKELLRCVGSGQSRKVR